MKLVFVEYKPLGILSFYAILILNLSFQVVAMEYDKINPEYISRHYETIYSLLDSRSEEYRSTFCETLSNKLLHLQRLGHVDAATAGWIDDDTSDDQMDTK